MISDDLELLCHLLRQETIGVNDEWDENPALQLSHDWLVIFIYLFVTSSNDVGHWGGQDVSESISVYGINTSNITKDLCTTLLYALQIRYIQSAQRVLIWWFIFLSQTWSVTGTGRIKYDLLVAPL
jgi:hypothetical protein